MTPSDRFPKLIMQNAFACPYALPGLCEQSLKTVGVDENQPFQILFVLRREQNRSGLAVARNDNRPSVSHSSK
jgi:hypothetical protein